MRFALSLAVALSLGGASSAVLAQPSPAAARDGTVITDGPGAPAPSPAHGRLAPLRRAAAGAALVVQRPSEAPLAIDGVATLGMLTGGVNGTFVHIGSDIAAVAGSDTVRVMPLIGKGSLQNLADLFNLRGVDLALVSADSARAAEARGLYPGLRNRVYYIAKLYDQEVHILAPHDVYTVADLAEHAYLDGGAGTNALRFVGSAAGNTFAINPGSLTYRGAVILASGPLAVDGGAGNDTFALSGATTWAALDGGGYPGYEPPPP